MISMKRSFHNTDIHFALQSASKYEVWTWDVGRWWCRIYLDFQAVQVFTWIALNSGISHRIQPPPPTKERTNERALRLVCVPTDVFWRVEASCLATTTASMVYPFGKVSLVARSQILSFVRVSTEKTPWILWIWSLLNRPWLPSPPPSPPPPPLKSNHHCGCSFFLFLTAARNIS